MALFALAMILPAIQYREWVWDFTQPGRFRGDLNRNFTFGVKALENGYLNLYEDDLRDQPSFGQKLDYTPLRLLTFEAWAAWVWKFHPQGEAIRTCHGDRHEYDVAAPLLTYYTALVWFGAVAAMLIVRHWLVTCARAQLPPDTQPSPWTGFVRSLLAFMLLLFDPGVAIISHGWPSPNMWVIPLYLWTVLFCLWDRWFVAGVVMGIGALMQGQQMFILPVFILWPLLAGRPERALRWVCGFAFMFVGFTAGWMFTVRPDIHQQVRHINWPAVTWAAASLMLLALIALRRQIPWRWHVAWWWAPIGLAAVVITLPAWVRMDWKMLLLALPITAIALAAMGWLRWSQKRYLLPLATAGLLLACIPFFDASTAWWEVGFLYGAERFPNVGGVLTNNLGTILHFNFGWHRINQQVFTLPVGAGLGWPRTEPVEVTIRQVMVTIYAAFFILAAFAIARQWNRKSPGLLVAIVLPWVLFFTLMPQMSPRYAVFAAGVGAICVGRSIGMTLLVLYFSALTVEQTGLCMMGRLEEVNWLFNPTMRDYFVAINQPGLSWATLVAAGLFLWVALTDVPPGRGATFVKIKAWVSDWAKLLRSRKEPELAPHV